MCTELLHNDMLDRKNTARINRR
jgi:hypothetical protein